MAQDDKETNVKRGIKTGTQGDIKSLGVTKKQKLGGKSLSG